MDALLTPPSLRIRMGVRSGAGAIGSLAVIHGVAEDNMAEEEPTSARRESKGSQGTLVSPSIPVYVSSAAVANWPRSQGDGIAKAKESLAGIAEIIWTIS